MQLSVKVGLSFLIVIVLFLAPGFYLYYKYDQKLVINNHLQSLYETSQNLSTHIKSMLTEKSNIALSLASTPSLQESLLASNEKFGSYDTQTRDKEIAKINAFWKNERKNLKTPFIDSIIKNPISQFLISQKEVIPNVYGELFLTNQYGAVVATTNKLSTYAHAHKYWWKAAYNNGTGKVFFDDRGYDESVKGYVIGVVVPVKLNGKIIGVLKSNIRIEGFLNSIIQNWNKHNSAQILIARTKGLIVVKDGVKPLSEKLSKELLSAFESLSTTAQIGKSIFATHTIDLDSVQYGFGGSYSSIDHILGNDNEYWHVVVEEDIDSFLSSDIQGTISLIVMLAFFTLLFLALLIFFINKYFSIPFNQLLAQMKNFRTRTQIKVEATSPIKEVNFLIETFNEMVENIDVFEGKIEASYKENLLLLQKLSLQSKEQLKKVLDSSLEGIQAFKSIRDRRGGIVDFEYIFSNHVACEIVQKDEKKLIGKTLLETIPGHLEQLESLGGKNLFEIYKKVVETGESASLTFYFENDGIKEWFTNKIVKLEDGFVVAFAVITKEVESKNILAAQSRLATMGEMISMIAHQWRQPLNAISVMAQEIEIRHSMEDFNSEELSRIVTQIKSVIAHMSETINNFRDFFKPSKEKNSFNIHSAIDDVLTMLEFNIDKYFIKTNLHVSEDCKDEALEIVSYEGEFKQVIINLINNAIEAIGQNESSVKEIDISLTCSDKTICIDVEDSGGGIADEVKNTLFEPYSSTKKEKNGTGLGLYMSKMILEKSFNSSLTVSNTTKGACFHICIPKA